MIKVLATDLHRLMKNSAIYPIKKSSYGQVVRIRFGDDFLTAYSSDDFVYLKDSIPVSETDNLHPTTWYASLSAVKGLELELRNWDGAPEIDFEWLVDRRAEDMDLSCTTDAEKDWDVVQQLLEDSDLVYPDDQPPQALFAVAPDRLRKLSLIQPGDSPIDMLYAYSRTIDEPLLALRIGKNTRLRIAPLDRAVINEKEEGLLWD